MSTEFFIGRYDLDFLDDFYPDNLPAEWRFDYYANQFNALLLPLETQEDVEGILDEMDDKFQLVFELKLEELGSDRLNEILKVTKSMDNITFYMEVDKKPNQKTLEAFAQHQVVFSSDKKLTLKGYKSLQLVTGYLAWNHHPVVVSSLSLSDKDNRYLFEDIAKTKQKTIIICRSAEGTNLEKARLISEMMGY